MTDLPKPKARRLYLTKQIDQSSIAPLIQSILDINANDKHLIKLYKIYGLDYTPQPIELYIDSYGGTVYQAFGLISVMEQSKVPVHTIVTGVAMSGGFMILIHGHKRFAYKHSTPMYHQVSTAKWGTIKEIEESLEQSQKLQKQMEAMVKAKTKIPKAKLKKIFENKADWYMTSKEALEYKVIDEIIK